MSANLGNALGLGNVLSQPNRQHCDEDFFGNDELFFPDPWANLYAREDVWFGVATFRTPWWPSTAANMFLGDQSADISMLSDRIYRYSDPWPNLPGGANGRLGFVGYTRDAYGSPLANCTVRCIRTSTNELVSQVTSNANGFYIATTPYSDAHFLVVHATGVAGATVDTSLPA